MRDSKHVKNTWQESHSVPHETGIGITDISVDNCRIFVFSRSELSGFSSCFATSGWSRIAHEPLVYNFESASCVKEEHLQETLPVRAGDMQTETK